MIAVILMTNAVVKQLFPAWIESMMVGEPLDIDVDGHFFSVMFSFATLVCTSEIEYF